MYKTEIIVWLSRLSSSALSKLAKGRYGWKLLTNGILFSYVWLLSWCRWRLKVEQRYFDECVLWLKLTNIILQRKVSCTSLYLGHLRFVNILHLGVGLTSWNEWRKRWSRGRWCCRWSMICCSRSCICSKCWVVHVRCCIWRIIFLFFNVMSFCWRCTRRMSLPQHFVPTSTGLEKLFIYIILRFGLSAILWRFQIGWGRWSTRRRVVRLHLITFAQQISRLACLCNSD